MFARLILRNGPRAGAAIPLDHPRWIIGRAADAELPIDDEAVSRRHCELWVGRLGATLEDLGSQNGTFLNGQPIASAPLYHGDIITVGAREFEFNAPAIRSPDETNAALVPHLDPQHQGAVSLETAPILSRDDARLAPGRAAELFEAARYFASDSDPLTILQGLAARFDDSLEPDRLTVFRADGEPARLDPVIVRRHPEDPAGGILEVSEEVVTEALRSRRGLLVTVPDGDGGARSVLCLTLTAGAQTLAVLYAERRPQQPPFSPIDLADAAALTRLASVNLERAWRHQQLAQRAERAAASAAEALDAASLSRALLDRCEDALALLSPDGTLVDATAAALAILSELDLAALCGELRAPEPRRVAIDGDDWRLELEPLTLQGQQLWLARLRREPR